MSGESSAQSSGQPWPGFKYVQVPGLANRYISRYLRTQRKTMRAFFASKGLVTLVDRMDRIRKSNKGMLEKNLMFQGVINEYQRLVTPGATPIGAAEASDPEVPGSPAVDVRDPDSIAATAPESVLSPDSWSRADAGSGVSGLASETDTGAVIEE